MQPWPTSDGGKKEKKNDWEDTQKEKNKTMSFNDKGGRISHFM